MISCEQEAGGWTLVARVDGMSGDFSPTSPLWANEDVVSPWDAADLTRTTSMKNPGWFSVSNQVIRVCYSGPRSDCATFTHNRGLTLTQFFGTQFAVEAQEQYTFETLMKKFGKHLDLGHIKTVSILYFTIFTEIFIEMFRKVFLYPPLSVNCFMPSDRRVKRNVGKIRQLLRTAFLQKGLHRLFLAA